MKEWANHFLLIFICFLWMLMNGCKTIQPLAPAETPEAFIYKPQVSEVNIPVEISVAGMEKSINEKVYGLLYEDMDLKDNNNDNLMLRIWKQNEIKIDVLENVVLYTLPLKVWVKYGFELSKFGISISNYNEGECAIALRFKSKVALDTLWNVALQTEPDGYEWIEKPVVKVAGIGLPITFIVDRILKTQQKKMAAEIDAQSKSNLNIKPFVEQAWQKIQEPIQVSADPEMWLDIKPLEAHIVPFTGKNGKITSAISMKAIAESHVKKRPIKEKLKLSALKFDPSPKNNFAVSMISSVTYDEATELAKKYMVGQVFTFKNKYTVKITDMKVYPNGSKMVISLDIDGSIKGKVFLKGIPFFDPKNYDLGIKEIEFDLDTKNKLLKTADWLVHGYFQKMLEPYLRYPLANDLNQNKEMIQKSISNYKVSKSIYFKGWISELVPKDIVLTTEEIKVVLSAQGNAQLLIDGID